MRFNPDIDAPLHFDDERGSRAEPFRIRNAIIVDGEVTAALNHIEPTDSVTAYASHTRLEQQRFQKPKHGSRATAYSRAAAEQLHHQQQYCPCRTLSPEEYEDCKCDL